MNLCPNLQKPARPSKIPGYAPASDRVDDALWQEPDHVLENLPTSTPKKKRSRGKLLVNF